MSARNASDRQKQSDIQERQDASGRSASPENSLSTPPNTLNKPVVLITGAAGRIGSALSARLAPLFTVVGLDVVDQPDESSLHEWIKCDLTSEESVASAMRQLRTMDTAETGGTLRIASVIHLAAYYDFSGEPSDMYDELTVRGTRRLLEHLSSLPVEQFILTSTLLVMKPDDRHKLHESAPIDAEWDYPQSKVRAERVIREHCSFPHVILRIAGVYDDGCHSIPLSQQIARINERRMTSFVFPGNTDHGQAMIHMDDLTACIQCAIAARERLDRSEMFLIAEPDTMSYAELQEQLGSMIHGASYPTLRVPKALAKAGAWLHEHMASNEEDGTFIRPWMVDLADDHYEVDLTHARSQLKWEPTRQLRDTLPHMLGRFHSDKQKWYEEHDLNYPEPLEFTHVKGTGLQATPY